MSGEHLSIRFYTSGICYYEDRFLLLRISKSYKICPGDWEWLTCSVQFGPDQVAKPIKRRLINNVFKSLMFHLGLGLIDKIIPIYPAHQWFDEEFNLYYVLYPILVKVQRPVIELNKNKFSEYKWVNWDNILSFDRKNYLYDYLAHLKRYGIEKDIWGE